MNESYHQYKLLPRLAYIYKVVLVSHITPDRINPITK